MGFFVKTHISELSFEFGKSRSWWGNCEISPPREPMIGSADHWPAHRISQESEFAIEFCPATEKSLDELLMVQGADRVQTRAAKLGRVDPMQDLVCFSFHQSERASGVRVSVVLSPERFDRLEDIFHRYSPIGRILSFGCQFVGFANQIFESDVHPTSEAFFGGAPYLVREELQFAVLKETSK